MGELSVSLNHLIGSLQERRRDREAERLGGLEVEDQLKLRPLPPWKSTWAYIWPRDRGLPARPTIAGGMSIRARNRVAVVMRCAVRRATV
jgi:hypothetical protein